MAISSHAQPKLVIFAYTLVISSLLLASSVQGQCTVPQFSSPVNATTDECRAGLVVVTSTRCTFFCDADGYTIQGDSSIDCLTLGVFTAELPTCIDTVAPVISCPDNVTVSNLPGQNYADVSLDTPLVTDNSGDIVINLPDSYQVFLGTSTIRFEAVDDAGNSAACAVYVTVMDTEAPNITCPGDFNVTTEPEQKYAIVTWDEPLVDDNSGNYLIDSITYRSGTAFLIGTTTVEVVASDYSSNSATCSFDVLVRDIEPPTLTCADPIVVTTDPGMSSASVTITPPLVEDNSDPIINGSDAYALDIPIGTFEIVFSATDASGNIGQCKVLVTVIDDEPPVLTCPGDITVVAPAGEGGTTVSWNQPGVTENSAAGLVESPISDPPSGSVFAIGTSTVNITAVDSSGNVGFCLLVVSVTDYNECEDASANTCSVNANCVNEDGAYSCACFAGYSGDGFTCTDNDECETGDDNCDANAACINIDGGFMCQCLNGFSGTGTLCTDVNECERNTDDCDIAAECTNTDGSFTCQCLAGYIGDGTNCADEDECVSGSDDCDVNADCTNTEGSFDCTCQSGYTGSGKTCSDVNECETDTDNCDVAAECTNADGSFTCQCLAGYIGDGTNCADEDECVSGSDDCDVNADCTNTDGSFDCTCQTGYTGNGKTCSDEDECVLGTDDCHSLADCTNTVGSFTCACRSGYTGDGTNCMNVNECLTDGHGCNENAECMDFDGTYNCQCLDGFTGSGFECTDVDECSFDQPPCDEDADCFNTGGSFMCQCREGFSGDGLTCAAFNLCEILTPCPVIADCVNEPDSYSCQCQSGYTTETSTQDGVSTTVCVDVDECSTTSAECDVNAVCYNTAGSYECVCGEGFEGDGSTCTAVPPCLSSPCQNNGICTATGSSYSCACPATHTGVNCNTMVTQNEPAMVVEHPNSQVVDLQAQISLSCAFQNVNRFEWLKNGRVLDAYEDRSPLVISAARASDQCYYWCVGYGTDGSSLETNRAVVTVNGIQNYIVVATFALTFNDSLNDPNSPYFISTASNIKKFIDTGLQNYPAFTSPPDSRVNTLTDGSVRAELTVFVDNDDGSDDAVYQTNIGDALVSHAQSSAGFMDPASVTVSSTLICPFLSWMSPYGPVNFTRGALNSQAFSTGLCTPNKVNGGEPIGVAQCEGDGLSPSVWQPEDNCGPDLPPDELLRMLEETTVTTDNIMMVAEQTSTLTSSSDELTSDGIESASRLLQDIATVQSTEPVICGYVVDTVQNILSASEEELAEAQMDNGATSRAVQALEDQLMIVDIEMNNGSYRRVSGDVAVEVVEVSPASFTSGLAAALSINSASSNDAISNDGFKLIRDKKTIADTESEEPDALIVLPTEIGTKLTGGVRCSFTTFADPALFQSSSLVIPTSNETTSGGYRAANTPVISATVGSEDISNLTEPVVVTFTPLISNATNATCVFWDFLANNATGDWSTEGCSLSNTSTDARIVCECTHLTNFAVLMDVYGGSTLSDKEDYILEILSYVGCGMSVIGLIVTILTYLSNRKLRKKTPNQILLCLCFSLLGLYVTFITMIILDTERGVTEVDVIPCSILAGLVQFFTLTSLAWMGVEGFNMYLMFVKVVDSYISQFLLKASFCAWGVPAVAVFVSAGIARETYAQTDFCFVSLWPQVGGLLVPIGLILLFNLVVFILVMRRLTKTVRGKQKSDLSTHRQRLRRFQNAICILLLMGLTWVIGYFSLIEATSVVVQGLFTVLNSFQGYFIFMLYCVRQPQVRRQWRAQFSCCLPASMRLSLNSTTNSSARFSSTQQTTRSGTNWKPNNTSKANSKSVVSKNGSSNGNGGVSAISSSKFNPNSVPAGNTAQNSDRFYQNNHI